MKRKRFGQVGEPERGSKQLVKEPSPSKPISWAFSEGFGAFQAKPIKLVAALPSAPGRGVAPKGPLGKVACG